VESCEVELIVLFSLSLEKSDNICFTGAMKTQLAHSFCVLNGIRNPLSGHPFAVKALKNVLILAL